MTRTAASPRRAPGILSTRFCRVDMAEQFHVLLLALLISLLQCLRCQLLIERRLCQPADGFRAALDSVLETEVVHALQQDRVKQNVQQFKRRGTNIS
jgi:hypothetical protein